MANWCQTSVVFYGDREDVMSLYNILIKLRCEPSRLENTFGNMWEGNVLDVFGIDWNTVGCRGSIEDYYIQMSPEGEVSLRVDQNDAYCPKTDFWDKIIETAGYKLKYVYIAEEPADGIYETTDKDGLYFVDKFKIEGEAEADVSGTSLRKGEFICEYFENEKDVISWFSRYIKSVKSWEDILEILDPDWFECIKFDVVEENTHIQ